MDTEMDVNRVANTDKDTDMDMYSYMDTWSMAINTGMRMDTKTYST
jgi:hypothetical protein